MFGKNTKSALRTVLLTVAFCLLVSNAWATRKFCIDINYNYSDNISGQDYLGGTSVDAKNHWLDVRVNNSSIWSGYADSSGCSPALSTAAGDIIVRTYPAVQIGSSYVWIFKDTTATWNYSWNSWSNMSASTGGSVSTHNGSVGFGVGNEGVFNVSAMMTRLVNPPSGYDFGLRSGTYKLLAEKTAREPSAASPHRTTSCISATTVTCGVGTTTASP